MSLTGSASMTNELQGNVESGGEVRGKLAGLRFIQGLSAYEVAVLSGFNGTVEEWLETLKVKYTDAEKQELVTEITEAVKGNTSAAKIGEVTLLASAWKGGNNLYSQIVSVDGVTVRSQVDLTPSVEQLVIFYEKDLTFVTENDGGEVTVYAIGQKPTNDYTIQVTITEVNL
jgi:hypothetical protein